MDAIAICRQAQDRDVRQRTSRARRRAHHPGGDRPRRTAATARAGAKRSRTTIRWLHSGLDDIAYEVKDAFQSADKVVIRCTARATNTREWLGRPPTGKSFAVEHIHIYRLEGDRIAEHWATRDDLGMMRQLGHLS